MFAGRRASASYDVGQREPLVAGGRTHGEVCGITDPPMLAGPPAVFVLGLERPRPMVGNPPARSTRGCRVACEAATLESTGSSAPRGATAIKPVAWPGQDAFAGGRGTWSSSSSCLRAGSSRAYMTGGGSVGQC
jgi:hypothetical protein